MLFEVLGRRHQTGAWHIALESANSGPCHQTRHLRRYIQARDQRLSCITIIFRREGSGEIKSRLCVQRAGSSLVADKAKTVEFSGDAQRKGQGSELGVLSPARSTRCKKGEGRSHIEREGVCFGFSSQKAFESVSQPCLKHQSGAARRCKQPPPSGPKNSRISGNSVKDPHKNIGRCTYFARANNYFCTLAQLPHVD
jgi:hypothetical protein